MARSEPELWGFPCSADEMAAYTRLSDTSRGTRADLITFLAWGMKQLIHGDATQDHVKAWKEWGFTRYGVASKRRTGGANVEDSVRYIEIEMQLVNGEATQADVDEYIGMATRAVVKGAMDRNVASDDARWARGMLSGKIAKAKA